MTFQEIVDKTREEILSRDLSEQKGHLAIDVRITGEGEGIFYIDLNDGKADVQPYEYNDRACRLVISADNFLKLCAGKLDPVAAFMTGKLKVEGSVDKALEFSKVLKSEKKEKKAKKK